MQHQDSKEKLTVNESPPKLINAATLPCKMILSLSHYTTTLKWTKFYKNIISLWEHCVWVVNSSSKSWYKVINAGLSQNQCLQCVPPATKQWRLDQVGRRSPL